MAPEGAGGRLDLASLSCEEDIEAAFLKLDKEEAAVGDELAGVLEQQIRLDTRLKGVLAMAPRLNDVAGDAEQLSKLVTHTAGLAERVADFAGASPLLAGSEEERSRCMRACISMHSMCSVHSTHS